MMPLSQRQPAVPAATTLAAMIVIPLLACSVGGCNVLGAISLFNYQYIDPLIPEPVQLAQFSLPAGTVAVLVDCTPEMDIASPKLTDNVARRLIEKLQANVPECRFISSRQLSSARGQLRGRLRRMNPVEIGNRLNADTLVRVELADFRSNSPEDGLTRLGSVEALVRVFETSPPGLQIWPEGSPAHALEASAGLYNPASDRQEDPYRTYDALAEKIADRVSKLFYDFRPPKRDIGDRPE